MRSLTVFAPVILAGCAVGTVPDAPSLLPRAIETRGDAEPVSVTPTSVADVELDARIAERVAAFDSASRGFDVALSALTPRIERARGAAPESERWIDGQLAIGELQQARTAADGAMADLEQLAIARGSAGAPPYPALDAAITGAQSQLDRQIASEGRLAALLGVPK